MKKHSTDIVEWLNRLAGEIFQIYDSTNTIQDMNHREGVFVAHAQAHIASNWTVADISTFRKLPELEVYYDDNAIFRLVHVLTDELSERAYLAIGIQAASGMIGKGIDAKNQDERTGLPYTIDAAPFAGRTLKDLEANLPNDLAKQIRDNLNELLDANDRTQFAMHERFDDLKPTQAAVDYLVGKKAQRARNGKKAQAKSVDMYAAEKQRAVDDMHRALERVRNDPDVKAGKHGAVLAACRRLCDWTDRTGHVHHGKFEPLTTSKKHGEPQYAPLMDWQGKPIKPETVAKNYRDSRKKPKAKRGTK